MQEQVAATLQQQLAELEKISGMTSEEAKDILLTRVRDEVNHEMAMMIKEIENQAKEEAEESAQNYHPRNRKICR